jgi:hypothetical protein
MKKIWSCVERVIYVLGLLLMVLAVVALAIVVGGCVRTARAAEPEPAQKDEIKPTPRVATVSDDGLDDGVHGEIVTFSAELSCLCGCDTDAGQRFAKSPTCQPSNSPQLSVTAL